MKNVEQDVYLIAEPQIHWPAVEEWLGSLGVKDVEGFIEHQMTGTEGEQLVELAARRCYLSYQPGLNPNVTKVRTDSAEYHDNILNSKHGCYDELTEVLTNLGWIRFKDLTKSHAVCSLDPSNGKILYNTPSAIQEYDYVGDMVYVDAPGVDLLVTPNHRMYTCQTTTVAGRTRKLSEYRIKAAEDVHGVQHAYSRIGIWDHSDLDVDCPAEAFSLLGFTIGDGHVKNGYIYFHLRRPRKISYLLNLLVECDLEHSLQTNDHIVVKLPEDSWFYQKFTEVYNDLDQKKIPDGLLTNCSREQLIFLYDGLINSDGSVSDCGTVFDTTSRELANQVQQLALHIGRCSTISNAPSCKDRSNSYGKKEIFRQHIHSRNLKPEVNKRWKNQATVGETKIQQYSGKVYCCTVPTGVIYVRRLGVSVWCGNSVMEHANFTFAIENVSRVFTHEWVRHRAGVAHSQESMRYVRMDEFGFWIPPEIRENEAARNIFEGAVKALEAAQRHLLDVFSDEFAIGGFSKKKQLTSAFRRIAPNGLATGIVTTLNARALRHIIELRSNPGAEVEVRWVVDMIARMVTVRFPYFFGDFERTYDEVGIPVWTPKYSKV